MYALVHYLYLLGVKTIHIIVKVRSVSLPNQIKETAKLPKHLQIRDFRRTWVTRAIKAGADAVSIMQVTGHKHISSLNAYTVNTPEGAKTVLDKVNSYDGE